MAWWLSGCKIFEDQQKILRFTCMASLTSYNTFKSLKQRSPAKVKKAAYKAKAETAMEAFLRL